MTGYRPLSSGIQGAGGLPLFPGTYCRAPGGPLGTDPLTQDRGYAMPVFVGRACRLDRIAVNVTVAGNASTVIRLGIYGPLGRGANPEGTAPLLLDAGEVAGDSTGFKDLAIDQALAPGWHLLVAVARGNDSVNPTLTAFTIATHGQHGFYVSASAPGNQYVCKFTNNWSASGALPSTPPSNTVNTYGPAIFLRASA